jgi:hypothetical protein
MWGQILNHQFLHALTPVREQLLPEAIRVAEREKTDDSRSDPT